MLPKICVLLIAATASGCCVPSGFRESGDSGLVCFDRDDDGVETCVGARGDCNDTSKNITNVWLGKEVCNGIDDDCDQHIDDGVAFHPDVDGDGHGDPTVSRCTAEAGDVLTDDDCDDTNPAMFEGNPEICDGLDNNCRAGVDEGVAAYADADGDGYGDPDLASCEGGAVTVAGDCDDADPAVHEGAIERCNGIDDDCDGTVDGAETVWTDTDADGWGVDPSAKVEVCTPGYAAQEGDCNDADPAAYPGAPETCDDTSDLNCDGSTGSDDGDRDGARACEDCDDTVWYVYPGAEEVCGDGIDENCDGQVDEGC